VKELSVYTTYDEKRDELKEELTNCLELARKLLDENIWGYDDMSEDYAIEVYQAVKKARDTI